MIRVPGPLTYEADAGEDVQELRTIADGFGKSQCLAEETARPLAIALHTEGVRDTGKGFGTAVSVADVVGKVQCPAVEVPAWPYSPRTRWE